VITRKTLGVRGVSDQVLRGRAVDAEVEIGRAAPVQGKQRGDPPCEESADDYCAGWQSVCRARG